MQARQDTLTHISLSCFQRLKTADDSRTRDHYVCEFARVAITLQTPVDKTLNFAKSNGMQK
jgi:hypothetical protein